MIRLRDCVALYSFGTSEGASKGWDSRGRGDSAREKLVKARWHVGENKNTFYGIRDSTVGHERPYHVLEGVGPHAGKWAAYEAKQRGGGQELAVYNSREEAEEHAHQSQG